MIVTEVKRARAVGAPLIAIATADQPSAVQTLRAGLNGKAPLLLWDNVRGYSALNDLGAAIVAGIPTAMRVDPISDFVEALSTANGFPGHQDATEENPERAGSILIVMEAHRLMDRVDSCQVILNLRDAFKENGRSLILLGPSFSFPGELAQDILLVEEELPTPERIGEILRTLYTQGDVDHDDATIERAIDALRGLASFPIEQAGAMAIRSSSDKLTVDVADLWDRKRVMIKQIAGLTMEKPGDTFNDIGGNGAIKAWARRYFAGRRKPRAIFLIDEIEKQVAGAGGAGGPADNTGVAQDQVMQFLTNMEDHNHTGILALGPGGAGKSQIARALAATFGLPLFKIDLGGAKDSRLGESEARSRALMSAMNAIAGEGGAFIVATCNGVEAITAPMRRRFRAGLWYFDLPTADERVAIGAIQAKRFDLDDDPEFWTKAEGWTGANIRDCCEQAYALACPIAEASAYVVSAASTDPAGVLALREIASGRFLSASYPGTVKPTDRQTSQTVAIVVPSGTRKMNLKPTDEVGN